MSKAPSVLSLADILTVRLSGKALKEKKAKEQAALRAIQHKKIVDAERPRNFVLATKKRRRKLSSLKKKILMVRFLFSSTFKERHKNYNKQLNRRSASCGIEQHRWTWDHQPLPAHLVCVFWI
jgi:hypothetical protein